MTKSTATYWNTLAPENQQRWTPIEGLPGMVEELTLSIDPITGEYTRLTRFLAGADTSAFGGKSHPYPEEVFIVSGRLFDAAFDLWLEPAITPAGRPANCMGRSAPMSAAWCWKYRFRIGLRTAPATESATKAARRSRPAAPASRPPVLARAPPAPGHGRAARAAGWRRQT
ncbi:MAG: hypothetical protein WCF44_03605 [Candidatus Methylophosphatis roskildensis]